MWLLKSEINKSNTQNNYINSIVDTFSNTLNPRKTHIKKSQQQLLNAFEENKSTESNEISIKDINIESILAQVELLDKDKKYYAQGFSSHIFLVETNWEHGVKKVLIIKDRINKNKTSNNKILNEYNAYINSYKLLKSSDISHIAIPKSYWVINNHDWEMMLMLEYIEGMTLFALKVWTVLPILYKELEQNLWKEKMNALLWDIDYSTLKSDKEIKDAMYTLLTTFRTHCNTGFYEEYLDFFERYHTSDAYKGVWFESQMARVYDKLSKEHKLWFLNKNSISTIKDQLVDTFELLHKNNIYHNDVNHRNIMLGKDGKIYIIDFDKTTDIPKVNKAHPDPKYMETYRWAYIEGDFRIINHFEALKSEI